MEECVYHYCSLDVFDKIITNKTLRMTDVRQMNDSAEVKHIIPEVKMLLKDYFKEYPNDLVNNAIDRAIENQIGDNTGNYISLATCFSNYPDLLGQWRGYGNNGMGISIGFDRKILKRIAQSYSLLDYDSVHYSQRATESFIRNTIEKTVKDYSLNLHHSNSGLALFIQIIIDNVFQHGAVFFKRKEFQEEKESRLVLTACASLGGLRNLIHPILQINSEGYYYNMIGNELISLTDISYFIQANKVVNYIDLDFSKVANELIKRVIIGPKALVSESDIRFMLKRNGFPVYHELFNYSDIGSALAKDEDFSITVCTSDCSYR